MSFRVGGVGCGQFPQCFVPLFKAHADKLSRLPESFRRMTNGREGSHQLLIDDSCRAVATGTPPPNHVWAAARYNLPGIVAHASSLKDGERLAVPDLGWPEPAAAMSGSA